MPRTRLRDAQNINSEIKGYEAGRGVRSNVSSSQQNQFDISTRSRVDMPTKLNSDFKDQKIVSCRIPRALIR